MGPQLQCAAAFLLALTAGCSPPPATEVSPAPVTQSPTPGDTVAGDTAVTATMLRVLAETADEFRTGSPVYLVAAYGFPHTVRGGFTTRSAADSARAGAGAGYGVFGPYVTPADVGSDSLPRVVSVRLEIETAGGRQTVDVNPDSLDALFFSESAFDKFAIRYYSDIYGPEFAAEVQDSSEVGRAKGHCLSRMCRIAADGQVVEMKPFEGPMVR